MKILIIEDERELANSARIYLEKQQFICDTAYEYNQALEAIGMSEYACIILDIMLPDGSGLDILKVLKRKNKTDGVVIVSAKNSVEDKIEGLDIGADDYLPKPFHLAELGARVSAIIRRRSFAGQTRIAIGDLVLDLSDRALKQKDGKTIPLTKKEYELLLYFVSNRKRVVTKEAIVEHLWGNAINLADNLDFVYSHIKNLRKKLLLAGCPDYIKAAYGIGYKFTVDF